MPWPRDDAKLDRVRALMAEEELDALVVRAPDNVVYLTSFWGMKGYETVVFPREGEATLVTIEASADDAARSSWTRDVRFVEGYHPEDPRPPGARSVEVAAKAAADGRIGLSCRSAHAGCRPRRSASRRPTRGRTSTRSGPTSSTRRRCSAAPAR